MDNWDLFKAINIKDISGLIALGVAVKAQDLKKLGLFKSIFSGANYL
jgi:hypothetical protein